MSKLLHRIVVLALLPCLAINPSLAAAFVGVSMPQSVFKTELFSCQALTARIVASNYPEGIDTPVRPRVFRSAASLNGFDGAAHPGSMPPESVTIFERLLSPSDGQIETLARIALRLAEHIHAQGDRTMLFFGNGLEVPQSLLKRAWQKLYPDETLPDIYDFYSVDTAVLYKSDRRTPAERTALLHARLPAEIRTLPMAVIDDVSITETKRRGLQRAFLEAGITGAEFLYLADHRQAESRDVVLSVPEFTGSEDPEIVGVVTMLAVCESWHLDVARKVLEQIYQRIDATESSHEPHQSARLSTLPNIQRMVLRPRTGGFPLIPPTTQVKLDRLFRRALKAGYTRTAIKQNSGVARYSIRRIDDGETVSRKTWERIEAPLRWMIAHPITVIWPQMGGRRLLSATMLKKLSRLFAKALKARYTRMDIARISGVSRSTIWNIEYGGAISHNIWAKIENPLRWMIANPIPRKLPLKKEISDEPSTYSRADWPSLRAAMRQAVKRYTQGVFAQHVGVSGSAISYLLSNEQRYPKAATEKKIRAALALLKSAA